MHYTVRKDFDLSILQDSTLDISSVRYTIQCWSKKRSVGAVLKFFGVYAPGSGGTNDARYIRWKIDELLDHPEYYVDGLVIDAQELDYVWGNDLSLSPLTDIPYLLVIHERQYEAYSHVLKQEYIRFDLRTALAEVNERMKR